MAKLITYKAPAFDKKTGKITEIEKQGYVAWLYIGPYREKFVLQIGGIDGTPEFVVHHATGQKMPGDLRDMQIRNMMARGHAAKLNFRDAAQQLIHAAVDKNGVDRVRSVIAAAPILNA